MMELNLHANNALKCKGHLILSGSFHTQKNRIIRIELQSFYRDILRVLYKRIRIRIYYVEFEEFTHSRQFFPIDGFKLPICR